VGYQILSDLRKIPSDEAVQGTRQNLALIFCAERPGGFSTGHWGRDQGRSVGLDQIEYNMKLCKDSYDCYFF
jgi:hypothetical protein